VTDRLDEIKQRNAKVRGFNTELDADWDWLITEVERLRGDNLALREALVEIREIILRRESERPDPQA